MNPIISEQIQREQKLRRHQDGIGEDDLSNDDMLTDDDWWERIENENHCALTGEMMHRRKRLLKIAELAVSAVEVIDREIARGITIE